MSLSPAELDRVEALVAGGETPAPTPPNPPVAQPVSFASLVEARRERLEGRRA